MEEENSTTNSGHNLKEWYYAKRPTLNKRGLPKRPRIHGKKINMKDQVWEVESWSYACQTPVADVQGQTRTCGNASMLKMKSSPFSLPSENEASKSLPLESAMMRRLLRKKLSGDKERTKHSSRKRKSQESLKISHIQTTSGNLPRALKDNTSMMRTSKPLEQSSTISYERACMYDLLTRNLIH